MVSTVLGRPDCSAAPLLKPHLQRSPSAATPAALQPHRLPSAAAQPTAASVAAQPPAAIAARPSAATASPCSLVTSRTGPGPAAGHSPVLGAGRRGWCTCLPCGTCGCQGGAVLPGAPRPGHGHAYTHTDTRTRRRLDFSWPGGVIRPRRCCYAASAGRWGCRAIAGAWLLW